jgi:hypothetical protein
MSFLIHFLETLWGKAKPENTSLLPLTARDAAIIDMNASYDGDDEYDEEEYVDEVVEPCVFQSQTDFVDHILQRSNNGENLYFDMFSIEDRDNILGKSVYVWWMPMNHPYARMLRHANDQRFEDVGGYKYLHFDRFGNIVAYQDCTIQQAVESVRTMIEQRLQELEQSVNKEKEAPIG